ncbi:hypothetical protein CKAH01_04912 [Colletotrichum kahawae]|uniref:CHAT domain-containing protein n=1 Tax=Colletotrichum kahawae TaxID=34407 RepID=A0AAD9YIW6_COLKA|nr:hypothetical protein CKAH01_04912 [Colletotrichum kahawae]
MMQLATDGPIVTINVYELRSDAMNVTEEGIQSLPLPGLTPATLQSHASVFNSRRNPARRDIRRPPICSNVSTEAGLRWLWDVAVRPILGGTQLTSSGRLWWITSGLAGRMPFHAAGNYARGPEENAPSWITSSYISSVKALKYGRDKGAAAVPSQTMLLVTMFTNPPPHRHLDTTYEEEAIGAVFGADKLLHLAHPDPETVLKNIPEFAFVHFACRGASINNDPNRCGLLLVRDGTPADLTIANLEDIELKKDSVAYISACSTAKQTDSKLAGEAIHLAISFQALAFEQVIGTMWGADDAAAGEVAKRLYKKLMSRTDNSMGNGQLKVATALHEAVNEYRLASPGQNSVLE